MDTTWTPTVTATPMTDDERWQAVQQRDAGRDGAFVYAVRSTGVYCRPTCPSRRPRRDRVAFFAGPAEAERAGFRPCRRCRPRAEASPRVELAERARRWIETHAEEPLTLAALGAAVGASPTHLQRTFKERFGVSPRDYLATLRLDRVKADLRDGADVTTALHRAGYGSSSRLYERARAELGMTPGAYRRGGAGLRIGYVIADTPLGRLLVGATAHGVCAVALGASDAALEAFLAAEYPAAEVHPDDEAAQPWLAAIRAHLDGGSGTLDLPLDIEGTPFQRRVWELLRTIPAGETRSYAELARALGDPHASRAVAGACAANPVALVVPCHRVVRADGRLAGYRWGVERKAALLAIEGIGVGGQGSGTDSRTSAGE